MAFELTHKHKEILALLAGYDKPIRLFRFYTQLKNAFSGTSDGPGKAEIIQLVNELVAQGMISKQTRGHNIYVSLTTKSVPQKGPVEEEFQVSEAKVSRPSVRKTSVKQFRGDTSFELLQEQWHKLRQENEQLDDQLESLMMRKSRVRQTREKLDNELKLMSRNL